MTTTRRDFLLQLAKGAAYAAPVVHTLAAPGTLLAQGQSETSDKGGQGGGMTKDVISSPVSPSSGAQSPVPTAPWEAQPTPSSTRPPGGVRPGN